MVWILRVAVFVCGNSRFFGGRGRFNDIFATVKGGSFHIDVFAWDGSAIGEVNPYFMSFCNTLAHCFFERNLAIVK